MPMYCQSCGLPIEIEAELGKNKDGSFNPDYCAYCYQDGEFTTDCDMDRMIEICLRIYLEMNKELVEAEARQKMYEYFPTLKRWKQ